MDNTGAITSAQRTYKDDGESSTKSVHASDLSSASSLDELIARYLDALDQYQTVRAQTSERFVAGYLKLSMAKMEVGHSRIGRDAYDSRLLPELRATVAASDSCGTHAPQAKRSSSQVSSPLSIEVRSVKPDYSSLYSDDEKDSLMAGNGTPDVGAQNRSEGLRRRTTGNSTAASADISSDVVANDSADKHDSKERDKAKTKQKKATEQHEKPLSKKRAAEPNALLQFVGLPPASLRGAQTDFRSALHGMVGVSSTGTDRKDQGLLQILAELAELESRIRSARDTRISQDGSE